METLWGNLMGKVMWKRFGKCYVAKLWGNDMQQGWFHLLQTFLLVKKSKIRKEQLYNNCNSLGKSQDRNTCIAVILKCTRCVDPEHSTFPDVPYKLHSPIHCTYIVSFLATCSELDFHKALYM
jgi:hypothetical protein